MAHGTRAQNSDPISQKPHPHPHPHPTSASSRHDHHEKRPEHEHEHEHGHEHEHEHGETAHNESRDGEHHDHSAASHGHHHGSLGDEPLRVALVSSGVLGLVAALELFAGLATGSSAVLSDSFHNLADVSTTIALAAAFLLSRRHATRRFPYGYHRVEDLAGLLVLGLILASAVLAGFDSVTHLLHPQPLGTPLLALAAALIGVVGNEAVGQYKLRAAARAHSTSLAADGKHSRLDGAVSLGAAVGVTGSWLGFHLLDPLAGLALTGLILYVGWETAGHVTGRLMDEADYVMEQLITEIAGRHEGLQKITGVHARWTGRQLLADLTIEVDATATVAQGHAIAEAIRHELFHEITQLREVLIHVDPGGILTAHTETAHHTGWHPGSGSSAPPPGH